MRRGIVLSLVFGVTNCVAADIINVPADYPTIQAAILAALEGDEIIVAPGTYNEAIFFNGHNITLRSDAGPEVTIIDATGFNDHTVRCILGEGPTTVLQGFTITGSPSGSGLFCESSSPTVIDCRFIGNNRNGMFNDSFSLTTVIDCTLSNNVRSGMRNSVQSNVTVTRCTFSDNGIDGMFNSQGSAPTIDNCAFIGNGGTGMSNGSSSPTVVNSLFTGSFRGVSAGGGNSDVLLVNCTVSGNTDGGVFVDNANITITNCIIWSNGADSIGGAGTAVVSYSNIEFGYPGCDFCILADPLFIDPAKGDYRLAAGSPCIDLGNNAAVPKGVDTDLDGQPRFVDDPDTPDCPQPGADCGSAPIVDMGAYEFQAIPCPWDLDGNGSVGASDLLILLVNWGNPYGGSDLLNLLVNWGPCP